MSILFLVGPRGSGKTLMASLLAKRHACRACDTDALIREKTGKSVADIVAEGGWSSFRALEKTALADAVERMGARGGPAVIATGGGIVLDPDNRTRMRAEGVVAYLAVPPAVLAERLGAVNRDTHSRPALTSLPPEEEIVTVLREREPLYRAAAHHVVDAARPPEQVVRILYGYIRRGTVGIFNTESVVER